MIVTKYETTACVDCVMLAVNDERPPEPTDAEPLSRLTDHEQLVPNDAGDDDAWHFSWSPCPCCGSRLGGDRTAVTIFVTD